MEFVVRRHLSFHDPTTTSAVEPSSTPQSCSEGASAQSDSRVLGSRVEIPVAPQEAGSVLGPELEFSHSMVTISYSMATISYTIVTISYTMATINYSNTPLSSKERSIQAGTLKCLKIYIYFFCYTTTPLFWDRHQSVTAASSQEGANFIRLITSSFYQCRREQMRQLTLNFN